jgi:predicted permease
MLLARASSRQREIGIRLAIGASRLQLLRQLLTETLLIAACGGALGLGLAFLACGFLTRLHFEFGLPFSVHLEPDFRVMGFAGVVTAVTALLFGLAPALQAVRIDVAPGLRSAGAMRMRHGWTARDFVVSAQIALSMVLVICSLLVVQSLRRALNLNLGFKPEGRFAMTTDLSTQGYDETRSIRFRHELLAQVSVLPGIESAGIINSLPLNLAGLEGDFFGRVDRPIAPPADRRVALIYNVSPGYFNTAGTHLLAGRDISPADQKRAPRVAVVNQAVVDDLFPHENPLGRRVRITTDPSDRGFEIVGVVETGKYRFLSDSNQPAIFLPIDQVNAAWTTLVVRTEIPSGATANLLRKTALAIDPGLTLFQMGSLKEQLALPFFPARVAAVALIVFGVLALILAATGLFALVAFSVAKRTRELGLRMALGATSMQVLAAVLQRTTTFCAVGLVLGTCVALFASRFLSAVLYGVDPHDGLTYVVAFGIVALVAMLACWNPVMRAIHLDPAQTLRED